MKRNKLLAAVMAMVMMLSLLAACGDTGSKPAGSGSPAVSPEASSGTDGEPFKVVYLVNGTLGSGGLTDNVAIGIQMLDDEPGYSAKVIEMGNDITAYENYFRDECEKDWDLIIGATFNMKQVVEDIALQYPEQKFMFIDGQVDFEKVTTGNMMGVTYQSNETGYMAGALAALMLLESGDSKIDAAQKTLGFVGSNDVPNINDFLVGYIEGIQYVSKDIRLLTSYVGSFEDVPKCLEMTTQLYNQGAQVVYGPTSASAFGAIQASADKEKYYIACDTDYWSMMQGTDAEGARNILSSSLKNMGISVYEAVTGLESKAYEFGHNYVLGIKEGAVGLAVNDNYTALVPEEIRTKLDEIAGKIADGTIVVGTSFGMETEAVAKLRDSMKP